MLTFSQSARCLLEIRLNLSWFNLIRFFFFLLQQQIHAQQVPGGPPQPMGALNPFGALGATMGLPHGPQGLLNKPPEHHRPDIKPTGLEGPAAAEERLVSTIAIIFGGFYFLMFGP